jgi:hypothetical protein
LSQIRFSWSQPVDGDAVQIEVLGGADNPYFVSAEFLRAISGFPAEDSDSANGQ